MVVGKVIGVFLLVIIGVFANRIGWLPYETSKYLSKLVLNIAAPCVVISSMSAQEIGGAETKAILILLGIGLLQYLYNTLISFPLGRLLTSDKREKGLYRNFFIFSNNGFMGFPITLAIYGPHGMFYMVVLNCVMNLPLFTQGVYNIMTCLSDKNESKIKVGEMLKGMLNPPLVSVVIGFILMFGRINLGPVVIDFLDTIGAIMAPLAMMIVGVQLSQSKPRELLLNKKLIVMSILRLIVVPGIGLAAMLPLYLTGIINGMLFGVLILNLLLPTAAITAVLAEEKGANAKLAAEGIFMTTLFSMITLPIASIILHMLS